MITKAYIIFAFLTSHSAVAQLKISESRVFLADAASLTIENQSLQRMEIQLEKSFLEPDESGSWSPNPRSKLNGCPRLTVSENSLVLDSKKTKKIRVLKASQEIKHDQLCFLRILGEELDQDKTMLRGRVALHLPLYIESSKQKNKNRVQIKKISLKKQGDRRLLRFTLQKNHDSFIHAESALYEIQNSGNRKRVAWQSNASLLKQKELFELVLPPGDRPWRELKSPQEDKETHILEYYQIVKGQKKLLAQKPLHLY